MEEGEFACIRLEATNVAAELVYIDEGGEDRLSFHSIPISDSTRIGLDVTHDRGWECGVTEAEPLRERAKILDLILRRLCNVGRGWPDTNRELAWKWPIC